jgi:hypothetical protein
MIAHSLLEEDIIDKEREEEEQQLLRDVNQHDHFTDIIIFSFIIIIPHCIACIILNMSGNSDINITHAWMCLNLILGMETWKG